MHEPTWKPWLVVVFQPKEYGTTQPEQDRRLFKVSPRQQKATPACRNACLPIGRHFVVQARAMPVDEYANVWPGCRPTRA